MGGDHWTTGEDGPTRRENNGALQGASLDFRILLRAPVYVKKAGIPNLGWETCPTPYQERGGYLTEKNGPRPSSTQKLTHRWLPEPWWAIFSYIQVCVFRGKLAKRAVGEEG